MAAHQRFTASLSLLTILISWLAWTQCVSALDSLQVTLYGDAYCKYASAVNPNITVPLNTCILTPGAFGFLVSGLVCDDGSSVRLFKYLRSACSNDDKFQGSASFCNQNYPSPMPGFVAYCGASEQLQITSTLRFPAATNILTAAVAGTTATTSGRTSTASTPGQASGTTNAPTSTASSESSASGWAALTNGERIGAIIALAVGIPSVIFAGTALWCMRKRNR